MNEFFETEEELQKCFLKWQPRLGLSDWNIGVALVDKTDLDGVAGESEVQWINKCGTISILKKEYIPNDLLIKQPHEETLIHEMLHFKFFALQEASREEHFYEMMQHQLLEEIAKALFLAEYNLDSDWWNVSYKAESEEDMNEVGVEIIKTEETEKSGTKYLNINVSNSEVERNPDIVRLCSDVGILEYVRSKTGN